MLVKDCMISHPIMIHPDTPAAEAQMIMTENKIRHLPVVGDGKRLKGLITRQSLALKPDELGSLNIWEISHALSSLKAKDLMVKGPDLHTITDNRTVERAAKIMAKHKIGCLPVVEKDNVVIGMLTETDLLSALTEMLGLPAEGVRVTVRMPDKQKGEFVKLAAVIVEKGWGIMGIGSFPSPRNPGYYDVVIKIPHVTMEEVEEALNQIPGQSIADMRDSV